MINSLVMCIGSNSNDRDTKITKCIEWLQSYLSACTTSTIYSTQALNGKDADYLNTVLMANCNLTLEEISLKLKQYEKDCGRTLQSKLQGIVPLDLDIVIWNEQILREFDYNKTYFQRGWNEIINL